MADTGPPHFLPYPDDYDDPADSPAAYEDLASATHAALETRAIAGHSHSGVYARVFVGPNAPVSPAIGDIWIPTA
jgi:hypothetical protein